MGRIHQHFDYRKLPLLQNLAARKLSLQSLEDQITKAFHITSSELRMIAAALLLAGFVVALTKGSDPNSEKIPDSPQEITTLIPQGRVLIPIQLKNFESVDSLLGPFGVVDLYKASENGPSQMVVRNVKLMRAPKNPSLFAVLVPQEQSSSIIKSSENGFHAVIKNQNQAGTEFVKQNQKRSRITYSREEP